MISELFERNIEWSSSKTRDDPGFFQRLEGQQHPRYLWIGCSDSRVPANEIVGLDPGELFVHRNIANIVHSSDMNLLAVLEYAVNTLRIEHVIVCGHYGCGGVEHALQEGQNGVIDHWLAPIVDLHKSREHLLAPVESVKVRCDRLCELNVELQVRRAAATPIIASAWKSGRQIGVHGWIYSLHDGLLRDLNVSLSSLDDFNRSRANDHDRRSGGRYHADEHLDQAWISAVRNG